MSRRIEDDIPHAEVDEEATLRGHSYVSIMTDIVRGRVVDLVEGRTQGVCRER